MNSEVNVVVEPKEVKENLMNKVYKYSRNGTSFIATVVKDKGDKIYLQYKDREDGFKVSRAELLKFYKEVKLS